MITLYIDGIEFLCAVDLFVKEYFPWSKKKTHHGYLNISNFKEIPYLD